MKKALLTGAGGHFSAALAVSEELQKKGWQVFWVGASSAFETAPGVPLWELGILPKLGIPTYTIDTGKIQRGKFWQTANSLIKLPIGFGQSLKILSRLGPDAVLSFGGYVSIPVAGASWILGVPILVHEQTTTSGLANRLVAKIAKKVAVSHAGSLKDFPKGKTVLTGNPVRRAIWRIAEDRRRRTEGGLGKTEDRKQTIYITGGSRGSQVINRAVFEVLPQLLELGEVYHQTGYLDYHKAESRPSSRAQVEGKQKAERTLAKNYLPTANFTPREVEEIYRKATLIISRAGANTVSELEVLGIPAILIPIPWAEKNEQLKNAKLLEARGAGVILPQEKLSGKKLLGLVRQFLLNRGRGRTKLSLARKHAARKIVALLDEIS